ncbi:MAG: hypothetical protein K8R58_02240, partial [Bacteroidales bacterium]|nr:hypothetical protein [Bacteroidales bacterium]
MKKFTTISLIFLFTFSTLFVNAQIIQWVEHFGGSDFDDISNNVVVEGNFIYVTGSFTSPTLTFPGIPPLINSGGSDMFVAKFDITGNCVWAKKGTSTLTGNEYGMDVAVNGAENVYVIGSFDGVTLDFGPPTTILTNLGGSDFYIAKFDMWGNVLWAESNSAGGVGDDFGNAIVVDGGDIYITGSFDSPNIGFGTWNLSATAFDIFVAKYNSAGVCQWAYNPTGSGDDYGTDIDFCSATNSCYVTGYFNSINLIFPSIVTLNNSDPSGTTNDIFVAAYSTAGVDFWANKPDGNDDDYSRSIAVDINTGDIFITGDFKSNPLNFGGTSIPLSNLTSFTPPTSNYFIAKYDDPILGSGNAEWANTAFANIDPVLNFDDVGKSIVTDICGNAYVTGWYNSKWIDFGTNPLLPIILTNETDNDYSEIFIAKYNTTGDIQWIYEGKEVGNDHGTGIAIQDDECDCPIITGWYESRLNLAGTFVNHSGPDETKDFYLAHICNYNCCQPLPCENPILLHTGQGISIGVNDPNWNITSPIGEIATTCIWHDMGWSYGPPFTGTQWISIDSIPAADLGTYTFERTFYIDPCYEPELCICVLVDDTAGIYLNDNYIGGAYSMYTPSVITAAGYGPFSPGWNTLKVIVDNTIASQMAFNLEGYYCCSSDPCDDVSVCYQQLDSCCFDIYLENNQPGTYITQIQFTTSNGFPSLNPTISTIPSGWTYTPPTFPSNILTLYPSTGPSGTFCEYFKLCLENDPGSNPQEIIIEWYGYDYNQDTLICYDTLYLECPDTCECVICENPIDTISTGPGAPGSLSADWTLIAAPIGVTLGPATHMGIIPGAWGAPLTGTNWISYCQNGGGMSAPTGLYKYVTQFYVDSLCICPSLKICIMVDDTANIYLNGNFIGTAFSQNNTTIFTHTTTTDFNINAWNTLSVEVINDPGFYTGFNLKGWVCCCECEDTKVTKWHFYQNAGLEFLPGGGTAPLTGGKISTSAIRDGEGCSVIHDKDGNLLFYTDGVTIWDRTHTRMSTPGGVSLLGNFSSTQSALIVPQPCNDSLYYVFTTG